MYTNMYVYPQYIVYSSITDYLLNYGSDGLLTIFVSPYVGPVWLLVELNVEGVCCGSALLLFCILHML